MFDAIRPIVHGFLTSWFLTLHTCCFLKTWCGLELPSSFVENCKACQCVFLVPFVLANTAVLVRQAAKIRIWLILGTKISGKSVVQVRIFLKCLNGSTMGPPAEGKLARETLLAVRPVPT